MDDKDLGRIENLQRKMYSRETEGLRGIREHRLRPSFDEVNTDWERAPLPKVVTQPQKSGLRWFLVFSIAFFLAASAYAAYLYLGGGNTVSAQNIGIEIAGPVSVRGGDPLSLEITIENRNATPLEVADLLVEFPDGTRDAQDLSKELPRTREGLGDIEPGGLTKKTISAVLFGEERSVKNIKITVEYRVPGSNAIFYKESEYQVVISSAPLSIVVDAPEEANSGQDLTLKVTVNSNSTEIVEGVLLKAEYPAGFSFKSADPAPFAEDRMWKLGDVKPGSTRTITIKGTLSGENLDTRVFRFDTGIQSQKDDKIIATPFASLQEEIAIRKPFVGLSMVINGSSAEEVPVKSGKPVRVDITYTNNLLVPVSDLEISLKVTGSALDKSSVSATQGFYASVNDTVLWNKSTHSELSLIPPGESGRVSVTFASRSLSQGIASLRNPEIVLSANVKGRRVESNNVPEELVATANRTVQIASDAALNARLLYYSGAYKNTGPMPPKAERETTYTVIWTITNGSSDLGDVVVSAPIPSYVRFIGAQPGETVSYNQIGGVITWNVGSVKAGVGFGTPPREAVFQIAFTPSVSQVGSTPLLINDMTLSGIDRFTGGSIEVLRSALTTRLTSDAGAKQGDETVVQ